MNDTQQELDDEILSACHDGELPPTDAAAVRRRLACEPELADRLDAMQYVDAAAGGAFRAQDRQPLPARTLELLESAEQEHREQGLTTGNVVRLQKPRARARSRRRWWAVTAARIASAIRKIRAGARETH